MLVAALGTACGGGGAENKDVHPRATEPRPAVAARSRSATSATRLPASRAEAPPAVVDHGEDVRAITLSLLDFGRWLEWHRPEPALVELAYARGSELARGIATVVARLRRTGEHIVEVDTDPYELRVVSRHANVVSWRVTEHRARRELVTADGHVLLHVGPGTVEYVVMIVRAAVSAPWRLLVTERTGPLIEVQL